MTRRRFYAPPEAFTADGRSATLGLEETRHLRNVLRLNPGDEIYLFDGAGREFQGEVKAIARDSTEISEIAEVEPKSPESTLSLTLVMALLKGEKFDLVVQKAVELGVTRLVPVNTARADARLRDAADIRRKVDRWERIALESSKQCGRARVMKIETPVDFQSLVDQPSGEDELRLMFAERGGAQLAEAFGDSASPPGAVVALIGSEGGWTDDELRQARENGWNIVTFGGRTLRAETAAIAVTTLLQHHFGDLR
jgi:16S rRNA (uracil1498-N3)-methyltransferase